MARRIRANLLDRRSLARFTDQLEKKRPKDWEPHLYRAWLILNSEPKLTQDPQGMVIECVAAAHHYLVAQSRQLSQVVEGRSRETIRIASTQIANCIKSAPAAARRRFNQEVLPLIQVSTIDLEVIESLFDATKGIFEEYPSYKRSLGAIEAIGRLRLEFPALGMDPRERAEKAIADLGERSKSKQKLSAHEVFYALTNSLDGTAQVRLSTRCCLLIRDYIYEVGGVWCRAGLWPGRARHHSDLSYKSPFHCFAELVLTEMVEPGARRHFDDLATLHRGLRNAHTRLPAGMRSSVIFARRRMDNEWLIDDNDVKHAQARLKISTAKYRMTQK